MKKKRIVLGISSLAILFIWLLTIPAIADPPAYQEFDHPQFGHKAIVADPLVPANGSDGGGYIRFVCQSQEGLDYSVGVKQLDGRTTYNVFANPLPSLTLPDGTVIPTSDCGILGNCDAFTLGSTRTDRDGDGELEGSYSLQPGAYAWQIEVKDTTDTLVLSTPEDDPVDFAIFP